MYILKERVIFPDGSREDQNVLAGNDADVIVKVMYSMLLSEIRRGVKSPERYIIDVEGKKDLEVQTSRYINESTEAYYQRVLGYVANGLPKTNN